MKFNIANKIFTSAICVIMIAAAAQAYVTPKIGGGQVGNAPMIMPEIYFDGQNIFVLDDSNAPFPILSWSQAPVLRPLIPPAEFNPTMSWAILTGTAYNFQYGWDGGLLDEYSHPFPPGSAVWIEETSELPAHELEVYYKDGGYAPIFGTAYADGNLSPDIWWWNKGMRHNVYAVPDTFYGRWEATYKVYLGDASTGAELVNGSGTPSYGSAMVIQRWVRPCPNVLQGDITTDCAVDHFDILALSQKWLNSCSSPEWCEGSDIDQSGIVDFKDFALMANHWLMSVQP